MKITRHKSIVTVTLSFALIFVSVGVVQAQYTTGYGTVYGSFGLAMATQNMYNTAQMQMQKTMARNLMIKRWGLAAVEKAEREAGGTSSSGAKTAPASNPEIKVPPPRVVHNYGVFRPDSTVDTGKALAEALGETPEEKALIRKIFITTKSGYEAAAAQKGWKNNIAGGMTFFTVTAMTIYRDTDEPSDEAVNTYYEIVNASLDEMPAFATVANKDKQNFNNMLIGFSGLLLAGYTEGKQNNDAATIETYKKLAGGLIQLVLKADAENLQIENGQIVFK